MGGGGSTGADPGICKRGGVPCVTVQSGRGSGGPEAIGLCVLSGALFTISLVILAKLFANFCLIYLVVNNNLSLKLWVFSH